MSELASSKETKIAVGELKAMEEEIATLSSRINMLEGELAEVKKAGTPYATQLDAMNALIVDNARLKIRVKELEPVAEELCGVIVNGCLDSGVGKFCMACTRVCAVRKALFVLERGK